MIFFKGYLGVQLCMWTTQCAEFSSSTICTASFEKGKWYAGRRDWVVLSS
jgi:hypothetical protein